MSNEETKEAVVEETKAEETKVEEAKVEEAKVEDTAAETTDSNDGEEELSPWYYFFSQGCGFCKKSEPIIDELNKEGKLPEILKLDMAEPDNQKLSNELKADYKKQCGTPWFINADTGEHVCGYREKDVIEKWLSGESIPEPPRMKGPMPKIPLMNVGEEVEAKWVEEYEAWLKDHDHMPDEWKEKQRTAQEILESPRAKSDPTPPPMGQALVNATDEELDEWAETLKVWQEENKHLPGLQSPEQILANIKARRNQMKNQQNMNNNQAGGANLSPDQNARLQRLEQKVDKLIKHLGVN